MIEKENNIPFMLSLHHLDASFQYVSPESEALLGYGPLELVGKNCYDYFHPEDIPRIEENHQNVIEGRKTPISYRLRGKDGSYRMVKSIAYIVREPDNSLPHQIICLTYPAN